MQVWTRKFNLEKLPCLVKDITLLRTRTFFKEAVGLNMPWITQTKDNSSNMVQIMDQIIITMTTNMRGEEVALGRYSHL